MANGKSFQLSLDDFDTSLNTPLLEEAEQGNFFSEELQKELLGDLLLEEEQVDPIELQQEYMPEVLEGPQMSMETEEALQPPVEAMTAPQTPDGQEDTVVFQSKDVDFPAPVSFDEGSVPSGQDLVEEPTQTKFYMSGDVQIPLNDKTYSNNPQRNELVFLLNKADLDSLARKRIQFAYALSLYQEADVPYPRLRPEEARIVEERKKSAQSYTDAQVSQFPLGDPEVAALKDPKTVYEMVESETDATVLGDDTFNTSRKEYTNIVGFEELLNVPDADRKSINSMLKTLEDEGKFGTVSEFMYDIGEEVGDTAYEKAISGLGQASLVLSGAGAIVAAPALAAFEDPTTITGEAISEEENFARGLPAVANVRHILSTPSRQSDPEKIITNVIEGVPASSALINDVSRISLRGPKSEAMAGKERPSFFSGEVANFYYNFESSSEVRQNLRQKVRDVVSAKRREDVGPVSMAGGVTPDEVTTFLNRAVTAAFTRDLDLLDPITKEVVEKLRASGDLPSPDNSQGAKANRKAMLVFDAVTLDPMTAEATAVQGMDTQIYVATPQSKEIEEAIKEVLGPKSPLLKKENRTLSKDEAFNLVSDWLENQDKKSVEEAARTGSLGIGWKADDVPEGQRQIVHEIAGFLSLVDKSKNTPEFNSALEQYSETMIQGLAEMPEDIWLSFAALPGFREYASEEDIEKSLKKWEKEYVFAAFDVLSLFTAGAKVGQTGAAGLKAGLEAAKAGNFKSFGKNLSKNFSNNTAELRKNRIMSEVDVEDSVEAVFSPAEAEVKVVSVSDEKASFLSLDKQEAELVKKAQTAESSDQKKSFEIQANAVRKQKETRHAYYDEGIDTDAGKVAFTQEAAGTETPRSKSQAAKRAAGAKEKSTRVKGFSRSSADELKVRDEFFKQNPKEKELVSAEAKKQIKEIAEGYNIADPYEQTDEILSALIKDGITKAELFEDLIYNSTQPGFNKSAKQVALQMGRAKEAAFQKGVVARKRSVSRIEEDSPVNILSKETKQSPEFVKDRQDSLKIAEELALSGEGNPRAYSGLNLTDLEIEKFAKQGSSKLIEEVKILVKHQNLDYFFEDDVFVRFANEQVSPSPSRLFGFSNTGFGRRLARGVAKNVFGESATRLGSKALSPGLSIAERSYYGFQATMEYFYTPFAAANIPKWYQDSVSGALNHYYSKGADIPILEGMLLALVKPSNLGQELYYNFRRFKGQESILSTDTAKAFKKGEEYEDFVVTPDIAERYLTPKSRTGYVIPAGTKDRLALHIHKNINTPIEMPKGGAAGKAGKTESIVPSEIMRLEVDVTNKMKRAISKLEEKSNQLKQQGPPYSGNISARIQALDSEVSNIKSRIDRGDVFKPVDDIYTKDEARFLTREEALSDVTGLRMVPVKTFSKMTDAEKAVFALAQEYVMPKKEKLFNRLVQLNAGKDSQKLVLKRSSGPKSLVARRVFKENGTVEYNLVQQFEPTASGAAKAEAVAKDLSNRLLPDDASDQAKTMQSAAGSVSDDVVVLSADNYASYKTNPRKWELNEDGGYSIKDPKTLPIKEASFKANPADITKLMAEYVSIYLDKDATANVIESFLKDIKSRKLSPEEFQAEIEMMQRQLLVGVPNGLEILKKYSNDSKKAWEAILNLNETDQAQTLGRALTTQEKFFHKQAMGSVVDIDKLIDMHSNFKFSMFKTIEGIEQNITMLKMQEDLRARGQLLTKNEYDELVRKDPSKEKAYVDPKIVYPKLFVRKANSKSNAEKLAPIFGSSLDGFKISRRAADFMAQQRGFQELQAGFGNRLLQYFKLSKILDPVGGAILRNAISTRFFHGYGAGPVAMKDRYLVGVHDDLVRIEKGLKPKDPRVLQIAEEGLGLTTRRLEVGELDGFSRTFSETMVKLYRKHPGIIKKLDDIKSPSSTEPIEQILDFLTLGKMSDEANEFLSFFKVETSPSSRQASQLVAERAARSTVAKAADAVSAGLSWTTEKGLYIYSRYDELAKTGYTLQLMDELSLSLPQAFRIADRVFIDYGDLSAVFNSLRYGGVLGNVGFNLFGMPFIGYTAPAFRLSFDMLTKNTMRSWMAAHAIQANDKAVENILEMEMSMSEYRSLIKDPTRIEFPFTRKAIATGKEFYGAEQELEELLYGRVGTSTEAINPLAVPLKRLAEMNSEDWHIAMLNMAGGPLKESLMDVFKKDNDSLRERRSKETVAMLNQAEELFKDNPTMLKKIQDFKDESLDFRRPESKDFTDKVLQVITPSLVTNIGRYIDIAQSKQDPLYLTKFLGLPLSVKSMRTIMKSRAVDSKTTAKLKAQMEVVVNLNREGITDEKTYMESIKQLQKELDDVIMSNRTITRGLDALSLEELESLRKLINAELMTNVISLEDKQQGK